MLSAEKLEELRKLQAYCGVKALALRESVAVPKELVEP